MAPWGRGNKAYEDFEAVAEDLLTRKVTTRALLGIQGGSNGGLLVGNMPLGNMAFGRGFIFYFCPNGILKKGRREPFFVV